MNLTRTVTAWELLWTLISAVGMGFHALTALDARRDREYLCASHRNGPRLIVARGGIRRETGRTIIQFCYIVGGTVAMSRPSSPFARGWAVHVIPAMFCAAGGITVGLSWFDRRDRHALVNWPEP